MVVGEWLSFGYCIWWVGWLSLICLAWFFPVACDWWAVRMFCGYLGFGFWNCMLSVLPAWVWLCGQFTLVRVWWLVMQVASWRGCFGFKCLVGWVFGLGFSGLFSLLWFGML